MILACRKMYTLTLSVAEHLRWYVERLQQSRVAAKIDMGEGGDVRLLKKVCGILTGSSVL